MRKRFDEKAPSKRLRFEVFMDEKSLLSNLSAVQAHGLMLITSMENFINMLM